MNFGLKQLALYVRDLLTYDEQLIRIGRKNYTREDFETAFIIVDSIGPAERQSSGEHYDGTAEVQTLYDRYQAPCTLNFYGPGAFDRAADFIARMRSQAALELQETLGLTVDRASTLTDVKALTGQQYGENIELSLNIKYNQSVDISTKRIDTAQIDIISEAGQELSP